MCNPLMAGAAALTLGGGVLRGMTNRANVDAQRTVERAAYERSKQAREAEQKRQKVFEEEAALNWDNANATLSKTNHDAGREEAIQKFLETVEANPTMAPDMTGFTLAGQKNATTEVTQEIARRAATAAQEARARVEALAKLTSYDGVALDRNLALGNNASALTTLNNLRRGSLSASQAEQTISPVQVIPGDNMLADILSGAGGTMSAGSWSYGL
jgi:hypothetical protein